METSKNVRTGNCLFQMEGQMCIFINLSWKLECINLNQTI